MFLGFFIVAGLAAVIGFFLRKKKWSRWVYGVSVFVHVIGALLTVNQKDDLSRVLQERQWNAINGIIDTSYIRHALPFHSLISYHYKVGKQIYTNEVELESPVLDDGGSPQKSGVDRLVNYLPGKEIIVYYHPDRPQESKLSRVIFWPMLVKLGLGYFLFGLGLCLLFSKTFSYLFYKTKTA